MSEIMSLLTVAATPSALAAGTSTEGCRTYPAGFAKVMAGLDGALPTGAAIVGEPAAPPVAGPGNTSATLSGVTHMTAAMLWRVIDGPALPVYGGLPSAGPEPAALATPGKQMVAEGGTGHEAAAPIAIAAKSAPRAGLAIDLLIGGGPEQVTPDLAVDDAGRDEDDPKAIVVADPVGVEIRRDAVVQLPGAPRIDASPPLIFVVDERAVVTGAVTQRGATAGADDALGDWPVLARGDIPRDLVVFAGSGLSPIVDKTVEVIPGISGPVGAPFPGLVPGGRVTVDRVADPVAGAAGGVDAKGVERPAKAIAAETMARPADGDGDARPAAAISGVAVTLVGGTPAGTGRAGTAGAGSSSADALRIDGGIAGIDGSALFPALLPAMVPAAGFSAGWAVGPAPVSAAARGSEAATAAPAPMLVATETLGDVAVALEGGPRDLRVAMSASAAAAGLLGAEVPRLAADLAAVGVRLQSLEISGLRADVRSDGQVGAGGFGPGGQPSGGHSSSAHSSSAHSSSGGAGGRGASGDQSGGQQPAIVGDRGFIGLAMASGEMRVGERSDRYA